MRGEDAIDKMLSRDESLRVKALGWAVTSEAGLTTPEATATLRRARAFEGYLKTGKVPAGKGPGA